MYKVTIERAWGDDTVIYVGTDTLDEAMEVAKDEEREDDLWEEVERIEDERPWWKKLF